MDDIASPLAKPRVHSGRPKLAFWEGLPDMRRRYAGGARQAPSDAEARDLQEAGISGRS